MRTTISYDAKGFAYYPDQENNKKITQAISKASPPPVPPHQVQNIALNKSSDRQARGIILIIFFVY